LSIYIGFYFNFSDVFGIFANPKAHRALIDVILNRVKNLNTNIDAVVGLEARGFIFGPQVALELQIPFVPVRKVGKLPGRVTKIDYDLEYGNNILFDKNFM
jgi:adenine phosphoribosyltransferase